MNILAAESVLIAITIIGLGTSGVLMFESWIRYMRVTRYLGPNNHFPKIHLRTDIMLFLAQLCMGAVSWILLRHIREGDTIVTEAFTHMRGLHPFRTVATLLITSLQVWNWIDRRHMRFDRRSTDVTANRYRYF